MAALVFLVSISVAPIPTQAGPTGEWVDVSMTGPTLILNSQYYPSTQTASEGLITPPGGSARYVFSASWRTPSNIPGGVDISGVRVRFYFKAYFYFFGLYHNEAMKVSVAAGSGYWGVYTYSPSNYLNGAYITINLGSAAEGNTVYIFFNDANPDSDLSDSAWILGQPVVQVYMTA